MMSKQIWRTAVGTVGLWGGLWFSVCGAAHGQVAGAALGPRSLTAAPRLLFEDVRTVDWAPRGDWIAFDRRDREGFSELWVARPDGSKERCLTCDFYHLRQHHKGSPTWHPSGEHIVFVAEKPVKSEGQPLPFLSVPGGNLGSDLWAVTFDGRDVFNLTNRGGEGGRALAPRFSHEGDQLVWSQRLASGGGAWGQWGLQVAGFTASRGVPRLRKPKAFHPGAQRRFFESYGFTPDDRGVLFAANLDPDQPEGGLDLYVLRLESGELERLTASRSLDRFARLAPDGRLVAWASSEDQRESEPRFERREKTTDIPLDLWLMDSNGSRGSRLTWFNDATASDYFGRVMTGTAAWSRDGNQLLVPLVPLSGGGGGGLYLLELGTAAPPEPASEGPGR